MLLPVLSYLKKELAVISILSSKIASNTFGTTVTLANDWSQALSAA
ncbi:hypothetical protein [Mucilaginibacter sp.]|nr:hypothetical protein [Mucilaginibacter sp.]